MSDRTLISILIPVLNEEENVEPAYRAVVEVMAGEAERYDFEIVFTDNHSSDGTFEKLRALSLQDPRVRAYRFSRNFGFQKSIHTAYVKARGCAAIQLDCDLQDPPSLIPVFLRHWEQGYKVVYGIRRSRQENWFLTQTRRLFYWFLDRISEENLPRDAGDFRLVDRRIIDELRKTHDPAIYIRGRIATFGFDQIGVPYDRASRQRGVSKFPLNKLIALGMDGIVNHSTLPLRLASYLGLGLLGVTLIGVAGYAGASLFLDVTWPPGFTTTVVLILLATGLNGLFSGLLGEYLIRVYEHLKASSATIIETELPPQEGPEGGALPVRSDKIRFDGQDFEAIFSNNDFLILQKARKSETE